MNNSQANILNRLRTSRHFAKHENTNNDHPGDFDWDPDERVRVFTRRMLAAHTEIHYTTSDNWVSVLLKICLTKRLKTLLCSPSSHWGETIFRYASQLPILKNYNQSIDVWKQEMFDGIEAAFTSTYGGIADTGTLILWPDDHEPRLMSLVPPLHIALLEKSKIYSTFSEVIKAQNWLEKGLPTNVLLISGPSKSADIEQTLTYGVHGPKELVVILI